MAARRHGDPRAWSCAPRPTSNGAEPDAACVTYQADQPEGAHRSSAQSTPSARATFPLFWSRPDELVRLSRLARIARRKPAVEGEGVASRDGGRRPRWRGGGGRGRGDPRRGVCALDELGSAIGVRLGVHGDDPTYRSRASTKTGIHRWIVIQRLLADPTPVVSQTRRATQEAMRLSRHRRRSRRSSRSRRTARHGRW